LKNNVIVYLKTLPGKLTLFVVSLILSLIFLEVALRLTGFIIQTGREATLEREKTSSHRDKFIVFRNEIKYEKWVIALGDSLTNGSNVPVDQSYPFRLYLNPENKISENKVRFNILNHGYCESNTYQSLKQLESIIRDWNRMPDIIIYLGGASDLFSPISNEEQKEFNNIAQRINNHKLSFFKSTRVYKIYRGIMLNLRTYSEYDGVTEEEFKAEFPSNKIIENFMDGKEELAFQEIKQLESKMKDIHIESILNSIIDRKLDNRAEVVKITLKFFEEFPRLFRYSGAYPLHRLIISFNQQSTYTADDISSYLKKISDKNPSVKETKIFKKYYDLFKDKERSLKRIEQNRMMNLRTIAKICKENNIKLILQNYPSNFTGANLALKKIAEEFSLPLVDNNKVFNEIIIDKETRMKYLAEDEHPSKEGYQIMADNVWQVLRNF